MGCRRADLQAELLRFAKLPAGEITPDPQRRLPGRGAYLHRSPECAEAALKRRSLERALGGWVSQAWVNSVVLT